MMGGSSTSGLLIAPLHSSAGCLLACPSHGPFTSPSHMLPLCPPAAAGPRPDRLRAEVARQAMPSSAAAGGVGRIGGAGHAPARGLEVRGS